jgi:hypothetical protein
MAALAVTASLAQRSLVAHMLGEHMLLIGLGLFSGRLLARRVGLSSGVAAAMAGVGLAVVALGHTPLVWEWESTSGLLDVLGHLLYWLAGLSLGVASRSIGPLVGVLLLIWGEGCMGLLALAMVTGAGAYAGYSTDEVAAAGLAMLIGMQVLWLGVPLSRSVARLFARQARRGTGAT